jgi:hypothetical protein
MEKEKITKIINDWKTKNNIKIYTPFKYFEGLKTKKTILLRLNEMKKSKEERKNKNVKNIKYDTDKIKTPTKLSKYHLIFSKRFNIPYSSSFSKKSEVTGVPLDIIKQVYSRGMGAWSSGHRVGVTRQQWGRSRVDSFLTLGCAAFSGDYDLLKKIKSLPKTKKLDFFLQQTPTCPKSKIKKFLG